MPVAKNMNIRFAEFELRREALELTRNGTRIPLQIQPFRVLELLLERAGQVVTREELRTRVWPSNVFVDFDHGLNNAIARLRDALGDSADEPRYIETLPRIGYRFIHPVEPFEARTGAVAVGVQPDLSETHDAALLTAEQPRIAAPATAWSKLSRWPLAVSIALLAIALFGTLLVVGRNDDAPIRSIAVLPFRDLSENADQEYFAAGMTEALITRLAQDPSLRVVSRRAAARYTHAETSIAEMARQLHVDGIIDASIVRHGNGLRVDVQLVRANDESHAWAQSYQRSIQDVFHLQSELADDISSEIRAGIRGTHNRQVSVARSDDIEAYQLYLQGRHARDQRNRQSLSRSLDYFQKALQLDPDFAAAHAGLAEAYATLGGHTLVKTMPAKEARPPAIAAARRAIELDAGLAEAHAAMAEVLSHLFPRNVERDAEIEREYLLALRLDPASAATRHGYGNFLSNRHRSDEAIAQFREALLLDPLSPNIVGRLGMELTATGRAEEGMQLMQRAVEIEPWQFNAHLRLGWAYAAFGEYDEANKSFAIADQISPGSPHTLAGRSYVAARTGDTARATAVLEELREKAEAADAPFLIAIVYVGLRDRDGALEWLERAASSANILRKGGLYGLNNPIYDWLRSDPRFERIRQLADSPEPPDS